MIPETKMMSVQDGNLWRINDLIKTLDLDKNLISDGYHTFGELYEHRIRLFIALCKVLSDIDGADIWCSKKHHDGSEYEGWFIMGAGVEKGAQISYHLPIIYFDEVRTFVIELAQAPEWDGHTSNDVLERLKSL